MKKIIILVSLMLLLVSCGTTSSVEEKEAISGDKKISIVTSIVPIAAIVNTIGGDKVSVVNMVSPGVSPHDFDPSPKDLIEVAKSDVVFYTGLKHIDGFLDSALVGKNSVVLSAGVALIELNAPHEHDHAEHAGEEHTDEHDKHETDEHQDEHDHAEHADEEHTDEHDEDESNHDKDPHFWTSSAGALVIATKIKDELSSINPDNKKIFQANFTKFEQELQALDTNFSNEINGKNKENFIIFHDAYNYLFQNLGIDNSRALLFQKNITGSQNPAQLQEFIDAIREKKISIFFREPQFRKSQLDNLTKQYNLTPMILDPLGNNQEAGGYLENYKNNLEALKATYK